MLRAAVEQRYPDKEPGDGFLFSTIGGRNYSVQLGARPGPLSTALARNLLCGVARLIIEYDPCKQVPSHSSISRYASLHSESLLSVSWRS